ncbi:alanine/glycine:cation symporter family protein [Bacillus alkalicellulosilyticus]|uniref:alanine/glycine:cation symporter family protein n=1 Tax=Alkalihalobacterium alkalicellulosilyticum TaxID=1912214 RepID=UPI000996C3A4|nr:alanine/glycine:cation symporter family protein [Bacillus alkalicellulosilyticus]
MLDFANMLNGILWHDFVIYACLGVGLLFSILTRFVQVRHFKDMIKLLFTGKKSDAGVSSFQALSVALSGRVGTGNIAGVATAIALGGPGAVLWMWIIAFIGSASAFVESALGQVYKEKQDGQYRGGPAYYIEKGIGWKWFAAIFAVATVLALSLLMPGIQSNAIASSMDNAFSIPTWVTGLAIIIIVGVIIFGGIKRIANVAQVVVPFMAIAYIIFAFIIILVNITEIPAIIALIFSSAFGTHAALGGIIGMAIKWGVMRGVFSNEAGQGTGPHAAAAAEVSHPAKQGLVQSFSVYIDTLVVCSATAFMILLTGMYHVVDPKGDGTTFIGNFTAELERGPAFTQGAIDTVFPGFGSGFVAIALFFFAFTTIMAYYYMAETNVAYLLRKGNVNKIAMFLLKVVLLAAVFFGAIREADLAWALGEVGLGLMVWLNLIAILILAKPALRVLKDYEQQMKQGVDPVFDPKKCDIENADFWENEYKKDDQSA